MDAEKERKLKAIKESLSEARMLLKQVSDRLVEVGSEVAELWPIKSAKR